MPDLGDEAMPQLVTRVLRLRSVLVQDPVQIGVIGGALGQSVANRIERTFAELTISPSTSAASVAIRPAPSLTTSLESGLR